MSNEKFDDTEIINKHGYEVREPTNFSTFYELWYVGDESNQKIVCYVPDKEIADKIRKILERDWANNRPLYKPFWDIQSANEVL